ncbi:MAG: DnaB-like helicase C-terminal domain-containing protein [Pseudomonadota bacterium]
MNDGAPVLPPNDLDAEEAVLGSILIDSDALPQLVSLLRPEAFYRARHGFVFEAMLSLLGKDTPINQITVASELARQSRLEACGGASYLSHLVVATPTSAYVEAYAESVAAAWRSRRLIEVGQEIAKMGYDRAEFGDAVADAIGKLSELHSESTSQTDSLGPRERAEFGMARYQELRERSAGIPFGIGDLDVATGGAQPGDLIIIGGPTGSGKTALGRQLARAMSRGGMVLYTSGEMSIEQLIDRDTAAESGLSIVQVARGKYSDEHYGLILTAQGVISEMQISDYAPAGLATALILAAARSLQTRGDNLQAVFVDYLQLVRDSGAKGENENQRIGHITYSLKAMARQLRVPVIAMAQLNRSSEGLSDKRPTLASLRDSAVIAHAADVVLFLYRDDYYYSKAQWERTYATLPYPLGDIELIVAKARQGARVTVKLRWNATRQRME